MPDRERLLARRGTSLVGVVKSAALVEVVTQGSRADEWAARIRDYTRRAVGESVGAWSPRAAGIVTAILIGDRTGLEDEVERRLQESGTYHVIAISGGNIAILAGLTVTAFRVAGLLGRIAMLTAAAGLVAYGFLVGGGASVNRAVLMAVVYFVGRAWDLRGPPYQALLLAAGALTLRDPLSVADPATLLTFGATAAIISTSRMASPAMMPERLRPPVAMLVASASTEALLLPVSAAIFGRVTFAGLVLNFGAIPLMAVAQLAGMAVVPMYAASPRLARLIGFTAFIGAEGLVRTANLVMLVPWSTWRVPAPSAVAIAAYYAAMASAWWLWRGAIMARSTPTAAESHLAIVSGAAALRAVSSIVAAAMGCWIVGVHPHRDAGGDGRLHVTFIDVGQGDAALIRFPGGSTTLVDSGGLGGSGSFDIGDRVVGAVMRQAGITHLGMLVLTHGDADHIGGAPSVLHEFTPWDVWDGVPVPPSAALASLRSEAEAVHSRWTTVQRADETVIDGVRVVVRHPPIPDWERQDVRNDDSIVMELRWRDVSLVFTGDVGRDTESDIAALFPPSLLRVVKVPHHGSTTSSTAEFVARLQPDVAVVSVGRSNPFGHPAARVLQRYEEHGASVFRTDRDGAVTLDTDGTTMTLRGFTGRELHVAARTPAKEVETQ
ncbi:MAG: DNA internalization-related competence protein ComEC/Rec2 [Vicinamibacterales bacterium]